MQPIDYSAAVTEKIHLSGLTEGGTTLEVLRLDKIHPVISGNKIYKLRYYLEDAQLTGKKRIITYGGAWSNHIVATAAACRLQGLACTGFIRGEAPREWSPTLQQAKELGMELVFLSREQYRLHKRSTAVNDATSYPIPEGGFGLMGAQGAAQILQVAENNPCTHICCAAGTGTMAAGLLSGIRQEQQLVVVAVLKNNTQLQEDIDRLSAGNSGTVVLFHEYHCGGYAKHTPALIRFMNEFYRQTGIPSDFVYTGKLFFAVHDLLQKGFFPEGSRIRLIHSGGLQGNASLGKGTLIF